MGEAFRALRVTVSQLGDPRTRHPTGAWMASQWSVTGTVDPCPLDTFLALAAVLLAAHCRPVMQLTTQYSGWGKTEVGLFGTVHTAGDARRSLTSSHFPLQEKLLAKKGFP